MKKNAGKIVRLLVIAAMTAVIIGTLGVTTSAAYKYTVTRYIGVKYSLPSVTAENDYGSRGNSYSFSDPPMVLFNGETITEYSDIYPGSTVENIKNRQQPDGMPENSGRRQDVREIWQNERESHLRSSQVPLPDSAEKESQ